MTSRSEEGRSRVSLEFARGTKIDEAANDVRVLHLRGVSSRSRPVFVEWHKHRGLWRYFRKFEADAVSWQMRAAVWCAIWLRFPLVALRQWTRA